jgi:putative peptidoglycan lipid II flippase
MSIARAALIIMLGNVASRLLGLVREVVIAGLFGATSATDAFTAASRVPTMVYDLLIGGMIAAALVPVFTDYVTQEKREELARVVSALLTLVSLVLAVVVVALALLAPWIIGVMGYGYSSQVQALAVGLLQVMLPSLLFMGLAAVFTALLYSQRRFTFPAFCAAAYNLGIILAALLLHSFVGITSLAVGVLLGSVLQLVVQAPALRDLRFGFAFDPRHPAVRKIVQLYVPVAVGLAVSAVGIAIDTNLASRTGEGNLAAMRFATTLTQFPLGLVATAMTSAILPTLSRYGPSVAGPAYGGVLMREERFQEYKSYLALGIKMVLLAILPAAVGLVVLREPIVQLLFQRGSFDAGATQRTALAFLGYSPSLPAAAIDQMLIFAFYALKNTIVPVMVGVMGVAVYLAVALALISPLGFFGLALANSAQIVSHTLVLLFLLWRTVGGLHGLGLGQTLLKTLAASAAMALAIQGAATLLSTWLDPSSSPTVLAYILMAGGAGLLVYIAAILLLRIEEARRIWAMALTRFMAATRNGE